MKIPFSTLFALIFCTAAGLGQEMRVFTNQQGATLKAKLVGVTGGQVTIVREDGQQFTLALTSLSAADQQYIQQAMGALQPVSTSTPAGMKPVPGPNDKLPPAEVNAVAGQPVFGDTVLWEADAAEVAAKLGLRPESKTSSQSSFRAYPEASFKIFGARPYSVALYAEKDRVTNLSLVFANKGDLFSASGSGEMHFDKDTPPAEAARMVKKAMDADLEAITTTLSAKLGAPKRSGLVKGRLGG